MSIIVGAVVVWIGVQSSAMGHFLWWLLNCGINLSYTLAMQHFFCFRRPRRENQKMICSYAWYWFSFFTSKTWKTKNWRKSMQQIVCILRPRRENKKNRHIPDVNIWHRFSTGFSRLRVPSGLVQKNENITKQRYTSFFLIFTSWP